MDYLTATCGGTRPQGRGGVNASWKAGKLNAAEQLSKVMGSKAFRFSELRKHIIRGIGTPNATLVPVFESLVLFQHSPYTLHTGAPRWVPPA